MTPGSASPRTSASSVGPRPLPDEVMFLFAGMFLAYHLGGLLLSPLLGEQTSTVLQWVVVAGVPLLHLRVRGLPISATLRLGLPGMRAWGGTVALAIGVIGAAALYMVTQNALLERWPEYARRLEEWNRRLASATGWELAALVFSTAITPAMCEEILFRGHLTRLLEPWLRPLPLCVLVGVLFGLFHANIVQIVPVAVIGMVITWVALAAGSLWPAVLMHLIFNGVTIVSHHLGPEAVGPAELQVALCVGASVIFLPLGLALLRSPRLGPSRGASHAASPPTETVTGVNS